MDDGGPQLPAPLAAALARAPRRYLLPPLPASVQQAAAASPKTALAFTIESARLAALQGTSPPAAVRDLFTQSLARLLRAALDPATGDAAFQALVMRGQEAVIEEYVRLGEQALSDRRAVRSAIRSGALAPAAALQRLARAAALEPLETVQRYRALCERRGPVAGTGNAAAAGRASLRVGDAAEHATVKVFHDIAVQLDEHASTPGRHRAVRGLRTPAGFPGDASRGKDEWDAAILRARGDGIFDIVLLAEVKASPSAAPPDYARLLRGLLRLAHAGAGEVYVFRSDDGPLPIAGGSLRQLRPQGRALPPHVIYCCSASPEADPPMLTAASEAVLLGEPASVAFAHRLTAGESPQHQELQPVWLELARASHLRSALHQYDTAQAARAAMLQPADLLSAFARK
ncbi:MAG: hypothetical protein HY854_10330 [Burkholderiales bacterium]|nr:hypothetical protein [Burkholderiales bacterium]